MKVDPKQKEEVRLECNISEQCEKEKGLTFGYIGNFERWGDDRLLMIWVNEEKMRASNGNQRANSGFFNQILLGLNIAARNYSIN